MSALAKKGGPARSVTYHGAPPRGLGAAVAKKRPWPFHPASGLAAHQPQVLMDQGACLQSLTGGLLRQPLGCAVAHFCDQGGGLMHACCKNCCKGVYRQRKGARRNSLLRRALQCRGDWIRTSDLLNPIQAVAGRKIARASPFAAYRPHTSHILQSGTHKIHVS